MVGMSGAGASWRRILIKRVFACLNMVENIPNKGYIILNVMMTYMTCTCTGNHNTYTGNHNGADLGETKYSQS